METTSTATQITSKFASIQWRDFLKGLLIAGIIPVIAILYSVVTHWLDHDDVAFAINWKEVLRAAFYGFSAYIAKNFFEPTQTVIVVKPAIAKEGEKEVEVTSNQIK